MGWGRDRFANWTRPKRPKAEKLTKEDAKNLLAELAAKIKQSPVLVELEVEVRTARGRFYVERHVGEYVIPWGRKTPCLGRFVCFCSTWQTLYSPGIVVSLLWNSD